MGQRWEYQSHVGVPIPDPHWAYPDTFPVYDSLFVPDHIIISDVNFYVGIDARGLGDQINVVVYSPQQEIVYLSNYSTRILPQRYFNCWYDTEDTEDGPGDLADYIGDDAYGWWVMCCYDLSPSVAFIWDEWRIEIYGTLTTIAAEADSLPQKMSLEQAQPNPSNSRSLIKYGLPESGQVRLEIFDLLGRRAAVLVDEVMSAGWHRAEFDSGELSSGVYFARLESGEHHEVIKMVVLK